MTPADRPEIVGAGPPLTPAEREADEWAEALIADRLPAVRRLAERWGASVAALTGLLGAGTVIDADSAVASLDSPWHVVYGVLVGVALATAALAATYAARAASGAIHEVPLAAADRLRLRGRLFDAAVRDLARSRWATTAALVLLAASFAVRWYAPKEEAAVAAPTGRAESLAASHDDRGSQHGWLAMHSDLA